MRASVVTDMVFLSVLLTVLPVLGALLVLSLRVSRELLPGRPDLTAADRPPTGLSRLVPVGRQVDTEVRTGLDALDLWLRSTRVRP